MTGQNKIWFPVGEQKQKMPNEIVNDLTYTRKKGEYLLSKQEVIHMDTNVTEYINFRYTSA